MTKLTQSLMMILIALAAAVVLAACGRDPGPVPADSSAGRASSIALASYRQTTPTPQFGPVVGPDYTPLPPPVQPTATPYPFPAELRAPDCTLTIAALQVALYASADVNSGGMGAATDGETLTVVQVGSGVDGQQWANTARGWLALTDNGAATAYLAENRTCAVLSGKLPDTANVGLHVITTTSGQTVLNFVRQMAQAGHPVATIKGLSGTDSLLNEIKQISPETVIVFRSFHSGDGYGDCPADVRDRPDPAATAKRWMDGLETYWGSVNADYFEYVNECPVGGDWSTQFAVEVMKVANERGRCLLLYSFPGGTPDIDKFSELLPAYQYAAEHECQPGRHHGIAIHAYSMEDNRLVSETDEWLSLRHRKMYDRLQTTYPPGAELPVYITELGIGGGMVFPGCETVIRDTLQYMYLLEDDPYVHGYHLWSVGGGTGWYDISPCLPALADALITYYE